MLLFSALIRLVTVVMLDLLNTEQLPVVNVYFCHNKLTVVVKRKPGNLFCSVGCCTIAYYEILSVYKYDLIPASSVVTKRVKNTSVSLLGHPWPALN